MNLIPLPALAEIDLPRLFSIALFFIAGGFTPGPNNLMVMASGMRFGFQRTLPHILGIGFGFTAMTAIVAVGLGSIFMQFPWLHLAVKIIGTLYLLYLTWSVFTSSAIGEAHESARPFRFYEAVVFQWVNPKAWQMAIAATAMFINPNALFYEFEVVSMVAIIYIFSFPSASSWTLGGVALKRVLKNQNNARVFKGVMAIALLFSLVLSWM